MLSPSAVLIHVNVHTHTANISAFTANWWKPHLEQETWDSQYWCCADPWQRSYTYGEWHKNSAVEVSLEYVWPYPYSLDLTPRDFHLFWYLKKLLFSHHFHIDEDIQTSVTCSPIPGGKLIWHCTAKTYPTVMSSVIILLFSWEVAEVLLNLMQ